MKKSIKAILPPPAFRALRSVRDRLVMLGTFIGSRSGLCASIYYAIFSGAFRREHQAVLEGRLAYLREVTSSGSNVYWLRRNVHRLEKGLSMMPRRKRFAVGYIEDTVDCYINFSKRSGRCPETDLAWAHDVLSTYFDVVSDNEVVVRARQKFEEHRSKDREPSLIPSPRSDRAHSSVEFADFEQLCQARRSVRWYAGHPPDRDKVELAVRAAAQAPSACNRQPYTYFIVDDSETVRALAKIPGGTGGFADNLPCLVILVGHLDAYPSERDRHLIYIDGSLSAMTFMLAAETLGLSTCPINWPDVDDAERRLRGALPLRVWDRVIMFIAVGTAAPDGGVPYSQKRGVPDIISYFPE